MKKEEFNLSEKLQVFEGWHSPENRFIHISHIKKFLKLLKDEYMKYRDSFKTLEDYYKIFDDMEKLAGDKLT